MHWEPNKRASAKVRERRVYRHSWSSRTVHVNCARTADRRVGARMNRSIQIYNWYSECGAFDSSVRHQWALLMHPTRVSSSVGGSTLLPTNGVDSILSRVERTGYQLDSGDRDLIDIDRFQRFLSIQILLIVVSQVKIKYCLGSFVDKV